VWEGLLFYVKVLWNDGYYRKKRNTYLWEKINNWGLKLLGSYGSYMI